MPMPRKEGYGTEWKVIKTESGNRRIYTRCCDLCKNYYEGRGARFCSKSCATTWGRQHKDYSKASFGSGDRNPNAGGISDERKAVLSKHMKERWANGEFTGTAFSSHETKLERTTRETLEKMGISFKQKFWLNKKGWRPKEFDFYVSELHLLIEVDGQYWHSLPENKTNDAYKTDFAHSLGYRLLRIPEDLVTEDAIRTAIQDLRNKQSSRGETEIIRPSEGRVSGSIPDGNVDACS